MTSNRSSTMLAIGQFGILSLFFAIVFLVNSILGPKAQALTSDDTIDIKPIEYGFVGKKFEGLLGTEKGKTGLRPAILMVHDWMGVGEKTNAQVARLAKLGYVVFALDIYGKNERPKNSEEAGKAAGYFKTDRVSFRARLQRGLEILKAQPGVDIKKIAAVGYCFGGTGVLELARTGADIKAAVSFHGGLDSPKPDDGKRIKAKILALHGADDPYVKAEDLSAFEDEMRKAKVDWQLIKYGGAVHSFTDITAGSENSKGAAYNASADKKSWAAMQQFFTDIF
jgi:dienelactone hydrolase